VTNSLKVHSDASEASSPSQDPLLQTMTCLSGIFDEAAVKSSMQFHVGDYIKKEVDFIQIDKVIEMDSIEDNNLHVFPTSTSNEAMYSTLEIKSESVQNDETGQNNISDGFLRCESNTNEVSEGAVIDTGQFQQDGEGSVADPSLMELPEDQYNSCDKREPQGDKGQDTSQPVPKAECHDAGLTKLQLNDEVCAKENPVFCIAEEEGTELEVEEQEREVENNENEQAELEEADEEWKNNESNGSTRVKCRLCNRQLHRASMRRHIFSVHGPGQDDVVLDGQRRPRKHRKLKGTTIGNTATGTLGDATTGFDPADGDGQHCFQCHLCSQFKCATKARLSEHIRVEHLKCLFPNSIDLQREISRYKKEYQVQCHECGKEVPSQKMIAHLQEHFEYMCIPCGRKVFKSQEELDEHKANHKSFPCQHCDKVFIKKAILRRHMKSSAHSSRDYACEVCGKMFFSQSGVNKHKMIHEEKRFICNIDNCQKAFTMKSDLQLHIFRHKGIKNYKCTVCEKSFVAQGQLALHMKRHKGVKKHQCTVCGKSFVEKNRLNVHMRVHTGEKPYKCDQCDKSYSQLRNLKKHKLRHKPLLSGETDDLVNDEDLL